MSGKSTFIRQVGLIQIICQIGCFVPASEARIGLADRVFTRVGAGDDLGTGRSTFMVEMNETANILHNATPDSLIILDEVGRGTSTLDGLSLAWAITEELHNNPRISARCLFATHYHELTKLSEECCRLANFQVKVEERGQKVIFLHKIIAGGADKSYGIHVAELAGLPNRVIERARQLLQAFEGQSRESPLQTSHLPPAPEDLPVPLFNIEIVRDAVEFRLKQKLAEVKPDEITPLQAMIFLRELKDMLQE